MSNSFKCYIIGDDYLVARCSELMLKNGNKILGILSSNHHAIEWATNNEVPIFSSFIEFEREVISSDFDYFAATRSCAFKKTLARPTEPAC